VHDTQTSALRMPFIRCGTSKLLGLAEPVARRCGYRRLSRLAESGTYEAGSGAYSHQPRKISSAGLFLW